jgi:hypothetical protein
MTGSGLQGNGSHCGPANPSGIMLARQGTQQSPSCQASCWMAVAPCNGKKLATYIAAVDAQSARTIYEVLAAAMIVSDQHIFHGVDDLPACQQMLTGECRMPALLRLKYAQLPCTFGRLA